MESNLNYESEPQESENGEKEKTSKDEAKKYKCKFSGCDAVFLRPNRLQRHINLHTNERPYKCTIENCNKAYTNSSHLKRHLQTHSIVATMYKCQYCSSNMSTISNLKRHYKRAHNPEREMYCHTCNLKFRKKNRYEEHKSAHENSLRYKCDKCGKLFTSQMKFRKHQANHISKNYKCPIENCSEVFEKWATMINHKKLEHVIEYTCPKCNKVFVNKSFFKTHSKIHEENRPAIPCPYENCRRLYYFKRNLNAHIRIKHFGKKFFCDICGLGLSTKQKIRLHIVQGHRVEKKPFKRKAQRPRKDIGIAKRSMLSKLTGIYLLPSTELKLMKRMPTALLRDTTIESSCSLSEDDRASDVSAKGA